MINDLTTGSVAKKLLLFAGPFILANLLQNLYNMVDMIIVGQFVGKEGLSAVSIGGDLLHLMTFITMGVANAGQIIVSQYVGSGRRDKLSQTIGTLFSAATIMALTLTAIGLAMRGLFLRWLNTPAECYDQASGYTIICYAGLFFIVGYNVVSAILRGMGDSKRPLVFVAIAALTNLVLDVVFVRFLGWKAYGAALATVIGQGLSFVISIVHLYRNRDAFGFDFKPASFRIDGESLRAILKLGVPLALQMAALSISGLYVSSYINSYGVTASAVTGTGNKISLVMSTVTFAFSTAGASMVGQNFGAGKFDRIRRIIGIAFVINMIFGTLLSVIMLSWPEGVFSLFTQDADVLGMAGSYAIIAVLNFFGFGTRSPFIALINGLGNVKLNMLIGLLDGIVARIGLSLLLGITFEMGIRGFWFGSVIAGYMPTLIGLVYFGSGQWKKKKLNVA